MVHRYNKDTQQKILKEATDLFMSRDISALQQEKSHKKLGSPSPISIIISVIKKNYIRQF